MQKTKIIKGVIKEPIKPELKTKENNPAEQLKEAAGNRNNLIALIKQWLPSKTVECSIKFAGDKMYLTLINDDQTKVEIPPQKLNIGYKFLLTRHILRLTEIRDYEFIDCKINFEKNTMIGAQYFIKDNVKYKKSFNV